MIFGRKKKALVNDKNYTGVYVLEGKFDDIVKEKFLAFEEFYWGINLRVYHLCMKYKECHGKDPHLIIFHEDLLKGTPIGPIGSRTKEKYMIHGAQVMTSPNVLCEINIF